MADENSRFYKNENPVSFHMYHIKEVAFPIYENQPGTLGAGRLPVKAGQKFLVCRNLCYEWKSIV